MDGRCREPNKHETNGVGATHLIMIAFNRVPIPGFDGEKNLMVGAR